MMMAASPFTLRTDICSWGRVIREPHYVARPTFPAALSSLTGPESDSSSLLAVGLRRSYGDTPLNAGGRLIEMTGLNRFIHFDAQNGIVRADAGMSLSDLLRFTVPKGWFTATSPGTRFVTLGGAVANDVHGKNHHSAGSFGCSVRALGLLRGNGERRVLEARSDNGLFAATLGGLGLTGVIEWVELQLSPIASAWLDVETIPYGNIDAFWDLAAESAGGFEHTVAWIDCLSRGPHAGRGIFTRANWRRDGRLDPHDDRSWKSVPLDAPGFALNRFSVRAFNELYYRAHQRKAGKQVQHYSQHFYPLDAIRSWNRLYGARGMLQYQCVLPFETARAAMPVLLDAIARSGEASFLAVLKTFGEKVSPGLLSFPRPGATLALDFPFRGAGTLATLLRLDEIVREAGGALYPAKDGRMSAGMFRQSFPRLDQFLPHKDPVMTSSFWQRVSQ
ncbi:L-gulonolactone oxidase [Granulibacter bethesdensis CGDNIH4]|nr:L-gulonolactone oxidase [Granulibacter bethesdensis CGDNIH4]